MSDHDRDQAERRTAQLVVGLERLLDGIATYGEAPCLYVHPAGELDARTAVLGLDVRRRRPRLFVSPLVPPGRLIAAGEPLDDPQAREVHP